MAAAARRLGRRLRWGGWWWRVRRLWRRWRLGWRLRRGLGLALLRQLVSRQLRQRRLVLDRVRRGCPDLVRPRLALRRGGFGYGGLGYGGSGYGAAVYNYFPTWGWAPTATGAWLRWRATGSTAIIRIPTMRPWRRPQPAATTVVYDYSQPINVADAPPDAAVADSTEQVFSAARDSFKAGDYQRALDLADQVLKQTPNVAVVHEFRALALFALKRYDEAAAVDYAVLSAGPGLELVDARRTLSRRRHLHQPAPGPGGVRRGQPNSSSARFLLAYHYMVEGHNDAGRGAVREGDPAPAHGPALGVVRQGAAEVLGAGRPGCRSPAQARRIDSGRTGPGSGSGPAGRAPAPRAARRHSPHPAAASGQHGGNLEGTAGAGRRDRTDAQGGRCFVWDVDTKGQKQTLEGQAGFQDNTLILQQAQGPPLVGNVTQNATRQVRLRPAGRRRQGGRTGLHPLSTESKARWNRCWTNAIPARGKRHPARSHGGFTNFRSLLAWAVRGRWSRSPRHRRRWRWPTRSAGRSCP